MNPALAARVRQLAAQAEHRHAIAEFRADRQARLDALLLEVRCPEPSGQSIH
jgi:hypothetical protein